MLTTPYRSNSSVERSGSPAKPQVNAYRSSAWTAFAATVSAAMGRTTARSVPRHSERAPMARVAFSGSAHPAATRAAPKGANRPRRATERPLFAPCGQSRLRALRLRPGCLPRQLGESTDCATGFLCVEGACIENMADAGTSDTGTTDTGPSDAPALDAEAPDAGDSATGDTGLDAPASEPDSTSGCGCDSAGAVDDAGTAGSFLLILGGSVLIALRRQRRGRA